MLFTPNTWNRIRYTIYTPVYDVIVGILTPSRKRSIRELNIQEGEKVLIVGAGTGLDLEYISTHNSISAIDITPSMVNKIKKRADRLDIQVDARVMDGHSLEYPDETFDVVILHLILAVIPDPVRCLKEVKRVLKPGGRVGVFDKFITVGSQPNMLRNTLNKVTSFLFSDINRDIHEISKEAGMFIISDVSADFGGNFRILQMREMG